jgi:hypothetical protein
MRFATATVLFALQFVGIGYARFHPSRYFCWAPFDIQTDYEATSIVNGHTLTPAEFIQRYHRPAKGSDNRSPENVTDLFQGVEEKRARLGDHTTIVMNYRLNGTNLREWYWPPVPSNEVLESNR